MKNRESALISTIFLLLLVASSLPALGQNAPADTRSSRDRDSTITVHSGIDERKSLPLDPAVKTGRLPNGLTYYIRVNREPQNRAELRLVVNAGSVLEADDQKGIAHFLEHMLFNGTKRFPEQKLVDFLERTGMRFGPDVNAYTSFDETVYMLTIPTDSARIVEQSFDVLEEWAHNATLSDIEIDKERGVVIEEWRLSKQNAEGRITEKILPAYLHGSRYEDRLPIGDTTIIKHAPYETVRRFYRDWYRPDLMAVVAVGDFDPQQIESLIKNRFTSLQTPDMAPRREGFDVPEQEPTLYTIATDPEYTSTIVEVSYKRDAPVRKTVGDYREMIVSSLFNAILNKRLAEISRRPDAPFLGASVYRGGFVRPTEVYGLQAQVQNDSIYTGLDAILTEATRVKNFGFTQSELDRQKLETLRSYQRAFTEREKTNSESYASEYVAYFLENEPSPGIAYEYDLAQKLLPEISIEEVNRYAESLLAERNRAVIVTMPEKEGVDVPTERELAAVFERVSQKSIQPYTDDVTDEPFLATNPGPGEIVARKIISEVDATEITLENGIKVVMKPTTFKEDEVRFTATSPGGTSLVPDSLVFDAESADVLIAQSGVGRFTRTDLQKRLAGKVVSVSPFISEIEEGLNGSSSPQDLETLFQLIHLYFTAPRADSSTLVMIQNQYRSVLANRAADPMAAFQDTLQAAINGYGPRHRVPTLEMVEELDLEDAFRIYKDRFADAGDFTFIFVGAFNPDSLAGLARTYLGSLPGTNRQESWRDVSPDSPSGVIEKKVYKGIGQQSRVAVLFHGPFEYNRNNRHTLRSLGEVLTIMLRKELREELGGVYGVGVSPSSDDKPDPEYSVSITFGTDPPRVDELVKAVFSTIKQLKENGPDEETLAKVREQQRRERETALRTNPFWVSVLDFYYTHPEESISDIQDYFSLIEGLSAEAVRKAAVQYLDEQRFVQVLLFPENFN